LQGGISPMAPGPLARPLRRLPPMLHSRDARPVSTCSKGSRGLSVLPRVRGIFTTATVSPGPSWRQCSSRYAIHAGRNLPDKELRYLRTVIVTAAVYRGFGRQLRFRSSPSLTYRHRAGVRLYTSSCELAESCVFDKQSLEPILCGSPLRGSTPCTEGTGSFCRVPSRGFSRTPSDARLAHLCRIAVRAARFVLARLFAAGTPSSFQSSCRPCGTGASSTPTRFGPASPDDSTSPRGGGILTACPSATPLGLALGPD